MDLHDARPSDDGGLLQLPGRGIADIGASTGLCLTERIDRESEPQGNLGLLP